MVRPRRAPHRSGAGGHLGGRGRPPRPLTVRAARSRSWPASPRGPQPPRIRARSAPPMVSPPPFFQSLPRPRPRRPSPRARVFVRRRLLFQSPGWPEEWSCLGPGSSVESPGGYAPGSPLCYAFGPGWRGCGTGAERAQITADPRPDLNAGLGAGGRPPACALVLPIGNLVSGQKI